MMNFLITLLTLAGGALIGSAIMYIKNQKMAPSLAVVMWTGIVVLFLIGGALSIKGEQWAHPHSLLPILSWIMATVIFLYGVFLGIAFSLRAEIKKTTEDPVQKGWIEMSCISIMSTLPIIIWVIFIIFCAKLPSTVWRFGKEIPLEPYSALVMSIAIGIKVIIPLWMTFHLARWIKKTSH